MDEGEEGIVVRYCWLAFLRYEDFSIHTRDIVEIWILIVTYVLFSYCREANLLFLCVSLVGIQMIAKYRAKRLEI